MSRLEQILPWQDLHNEKPNFLMRMGGCLSASATSETSRQIEHNKAKARPRSREGRLSINHCLPIAPEAASEAQRQTKRITQTKRKGQHTVTFDASL